MNFRKAKKKRRSTGVCQECGKPSVIIDPEQAARDLLEGINKGLEGNELLRFATRSLRPK